MAETSPYTPDAQALAQASALCGARTRSGCPCKNHPVRGKRRCRMHGGAKGSGGQLGNKNAWKHGLYTEELKGERIAARQLLRTMQKVKIITLGG